MKGFQLVLAVLLLHVSSTAGQPSFSSFVQQMHAQCRTPPPGFNYSVPWNIAHPAYCNGYIRCANGAAIFPCEICVPGTIFLPGTFGVCNTATGSNKNACRQGRRLVSFLEVQLVRSRAADCNPEAFHALQNGGGNSWGGGGWTQNGGGGNTGGTGYQGGGGGCSGGCGGGTWGEA